MRIARKWPCCGQEHYMFTIQGHKNQGPLEFCDVQGSVCNCFAAEKNCYQNFICTMEGCKRKHSKYLHLPSRRPKRDDTTPKATPIVPVIDTSIEPDTSECQNEWWKSGPTNNTSQRQVSRYKMTQIIYWYMTRHMDSPSFARRKCL